MQRLPKSISDPPRPAPHEAGLGAPPCPSPAVPGFVPPHPPRPVARLPLAETVRRFRRSMLDVWRARHFETDFFVTRILRRSLAICNSPETVREAFLENAAVLERKSPQMRHALAPLLGDGLFISDGALWKERRRAVAPVTHASRMPTLTPVMTEVAGAFAARWRSLPEGAEIDALAEMAEMTAEVIGRTLFGRKVGSTAARTVVEAFSAYQARVGQTSLASMLGLPDWLPALPRPRLAVESRRIRKVLDGLIAAALAEGGGADASLVQAMQAGEVTSLAALRNEAATLFMAGHETTANTLAWAWFLLSQVPEAADRVAAEAQAALGGRAAGLPDMPALAFTQAVIEETLRLYPPVPVLAREATAEITLAGRRLPRGTLVLVVPWLLHRNPKLWPEPDTFRPERFLTGSPPRYGYIPFSIGPRVCSGQQFGLTEAVLCLATLAQHVRLELRPGHVVVPISRLTLRPGAELPMQIRHRGAA
jgi:cytochrome P450